MNVGAKREHPSKETRAREDALAARTELINELMTTSEVAARLGGTSTKMVGRFIRAGMLDALYFGRYARVPIKSINKFIHDFIGKDVIAELEKREAQMNDSGIEAAS